MRKAIPALVLLALVAGVPSAGHAQARKKAEDHVVGTRWEFEATHGQESEKGVFRVHNLEVFRGQRKVGRVTPKSPTQTTLHIDGFPKLDGTVNLHKIDRRPPVWEGTLIRTDGSKWHIVVDIRET